MLIYAIIIVVLIIVIVLSVRNLLSINKTDEVEVTKPVIETPKGEGDTKVEQKQEKPQNNVIKNDEYPIKRPDIGSELIGFAVLGFIGAIVSVGFGFYKMLVYEEHERNAYVGGDAYNYIINANYSTAFFVLGLILMVFACSMLIMNEIQKLNR